MENCSSKRPSLSASSCCPVSCRLSGPAGSGHLILLRNVLHCAVFIGRMMERGPASQDKQLLCSLWRSPGPQLPAWLAARALLGLIHKHWHTAGGGSGMYEHRLDLCCSVCRCENPLQGNATEMRRPIFTIQPILNGYNLDKHNILVPYWLLADIRLLFCLLVGIGQYCTYTNTNFLYFLCI